ncbi:hypothetical protein [Catellatospora sp. NPDC049609]|uniref:hypothetical protein n=1 Tax=Catellatospora sp. NPDC049609 TaxID=3155505 RepID=UPI0034310BA2
MSAVVAADGSGNGQDGSGSGQDGSGSRQGAPVIALRPRPGARRAEERAEHGSARHHRVETIQRVRRVADDSGDTEIVLPDWLGPVSEPDAGSAPLRARQAG